MPAPAITATILVVEDEWLIADMVACILEDAGHRVIGPAGSTAEARDLIVATHLDLALLDVNLGTELSLDLADELIARGVPVMLTTGYSITELPSRFQNFPTLSKPVSPWRLGEAVRTALTG